MKAYLTTYEKAHYRRRHGIGITTTPVFKRLITDDCHVEFLQKDGRRIQVHFEGDTVRLRTPDGVFAVIPEASNTFRAQAVEWSALIEEMERGEKLLGKKNKGVGSKRRLSAHSKKD